MQIRVAILEDDSTLGELMVETMLNYGMWAEHFARAEDLPVGKRFDAFVLDWALGDNTSSETVRKLARSGYAGRIIVLSGSSRFSDDGLAEIACMDEVVVQEKPVRVQDLVERLRSMCEVGARRVAWNAEPGNQKE